MTTGVPAPEPDVLVRVGLVVDAAGTRGRPTVRRRMAGAVVLRPSVEVARIGGVPVSAADGSLLLDLLCPVELAPLPPGQVYGACTVEVEVQPGVRVQLVRDAPDHEVSGIGTATAGRTFPALGRMRELVLHALVAAPETTALTGTISVQVEIRRSIGRFVTTLLAVSEHVTPFTEPVRDGTAVRLVVALDMRRYSSRDLGGTARAQQRLADIVRRACAGTAVDVEDRQESGDGVMLVFPPGIDEAAVLRGFYAEFAAALDQTNVDLHDGARIRLRCGVDRGLTRRGSSGWVGPGPVHAGRLRDCGPTRDALDGADDVPFVLMVADCIHRDVFGEDGLRPAARTFVRTEIADGQKGFAAVGWLHVPGPS